MPGKAEGHPLWVKVAFVGGMLILAFLVSRGCQDEQVQISSDEAVEVARAEVDFEPTDTQIRLLRQGINREPFWFVSLGLESKRDPDIFARLAVVKIAAETGEVIEIEEDRGRDKEAAQQAQDGGTGGQNQGQAEP
jgi:hypothetical protein